MKDNQLFGSTRLRLALWYAGVMACIMGVSGFGVYQVVAQAYRRTIDQGLQAVTGVVAKRIEPVIQRPEQLRQVAENLSLRLCLAEADCIPTTEATKAAQLPEVIRPPLVGVPDPINYYIRLIDSTGRPIVVMGLQIDKLPSTSGKAKWQTLTDRQGIRYRQVSLPLQIQKQPGGYVQVGRSLQDLDQNLVALRWTLLLGCAIALLFVAWSSWWLAGLAMQPIYRSYQQMQQFTADAAHEFRTPLAAMQATIESTLRFQSKSESSTLETAGGALAVLQRQTLRLSELVKDLLLLTRIDQRKLTGKHFACCLNDLISDLIEELAFLAVKEAVELSMQLQVPTSVYVLGDEEQLYRLVCNLINNAIQATPTGGQVRVSLNRDEQYAIVQVQDTGLGIAPADQVRIFDRFYRVEQDRSRHTGGSGLGLPIALAIAQAHRGTLQVRSELGKGSTFTVRLPLE
ncbi:MULTISPECIES: two-component system sensor histidine kinase RppB [Trichocoleus]|uniref:histidine kinase n=1 Tax=Trichocoleus desertorum GB2-A4 TaxID=2933944 RepID=A0ABV0JF43_9CYAN|nr:two-component system sensor histidine kinase RppB [Trichocoleus sp. FACHB-46]MBD1864916.1 two-component sensor histidine kinase [Trichocoleus sp. FACHB-46]